MSMGTTPLTIHVPDSRPMSSRMTMGEPMLPTARLISASSSCHFLPKWSMAIRAATPVENMSTNWLGPESASIP